MMKKQLDNDSKKRKIRLCNCDGQGRKKNVNREK